MVTGKIKGIRTDCCTQEDKEVELEYKIDRKEKGTYVEHVFKLIGGPTGYEGFNIDGCGRPLPEMSRNGWTACMGTVKSWDKLSIPPKEMEKVMEKFVESVELCFNCKCTILTESRFCARCGHEMITNCRECQFDMNCPPGIRGKTPWDCGTFKKAPWVKD